MDYRESGVDIQKGNETVKRIKPLVKQTFTANVLSELGSFGGLYALDKNKWAQPVLISSTDGVGTKLCVAKAADKYHTIGEDLVNHSVNDIFVHGATPLFFLDYIGINRVEPDRIEKVVSGMVKACKEHDMALIGGETAEMPSIYAEDDLDLVGTIIGCVDRDRIINGSRISEDDILVGFPSTGLHTNGYTLARKILFAEQKLKVDSYIEDLGSSVGEALLRVHKSYYHLLKGYADPDRIHGMAHITGGGIGGNLSRIIPQGLSAEIDKSNWEIPKIFQYLQRVGGISEEEMYNVFNMGIGFITVTESNTARDLIRNAGGIFIGRMRQDEGRERVELTSDTLAGYSV